MNQRIDIAIQHSIHITDCQLRAVIFNQPIRSKNIASNLAAEVDLELCIFELTVLGAFLVHLEFVKLCPELLHRARAILMLRSLILALHDDTRGQMSHANGRVRTIHVLAARAACPERIDSKIFRPNIDLDLVINLRVHEHGREGRVPPRICIERRDAYEPMDSYFGLQASVDILAVDLERYGLDSRAFALKTIRDYGLDSRAAQPSADTCATASPPNPDFQCRRRQGG